MNDYRDDFGLYDGDNPMIVSTNTPFALLFAQTRETLDVETYSSFIHNAISRFRASRFYTAYKANLIEMGMNRCQIHGNITNEMATVEMHHNMLTIYEIAIIITEHFLNKYGSVTTFDVVKQLKEEHAKNHVQLVMLSLTPHQVFHANKDFFIHPKMCFGNWKEFLYEYMNDLTMDIAYKLLYYFKKAIDSDETYDNGLLDLMDKVRSWIEVNEIQNRR